MVELQWEKLLISSWKLESLEGTLTITNVYYGECSIGDARYYFNFEKFSGKV
jgi:hypothetical protein